jgi:hypothetical protein
VMRIGTESCGVKNLDSVEIFVHNYAHADGAAPGTGGLFGSKIGPALRADLKA